MILRFLLFSSLSPLKFSKEESWAYCILKRQIVKIVDYCRWHVKAYLATSRTFCTPSPLTRRASGTLFSPTALSSAEKCTIVSIWLLTTVSAIAAWFRMSKYWYGAAKNNQHKSCKESFSRILSKCGLASNDDQKFTEAAVLRCFKDVGHEHAVFSIHVPSIKICRWFFSRL